MASLISPVVVPDHPVGFGGLVSAWTLQPVAVVLAVAALALYGRAVVRTPGWPVRRTLAFGVGVALFAWTSCGFLELYGHTLFWVWTVQALVLLLIVPVLVMAGQPLELARRRGARLGRLTETGPGRVLTSPVVGPLLVPVVTAALVFGPLAGWAVAHPPVEWLTQLGVLVVGCAIALPLVTSSTRATSLAVGLALVVGVFELLLDAVPGFALRFQTHITTAYFDLRPAANQLVAALTPIKDQQRAGGIVWVVAELLDLPFVILLFRQWVKADARDARSIDTVLDAEAIARPAVGDGTTGDATAPWWESDPRFRR